MGRTDETATRLTVFLSEDEQVGHRGLGQVLVERAREAGLGGATLWRGVEGFGASTTVRTTRFPDLASGLPLVVEIIDRPDLVEAFLPVVAELAPGSLVTREPVTVIRQP